MVTLGVARDGPHSFVLRGAPQYHAALRLELVDGLIRVLAAIDDVVRQRHRRRTRDAALAVHVDTFAGGHVFQALLHERGAAPQGRLVRRRRVLEGQA